MLKRPKPSPFRGNARLFTIAGLSVIVSGAIIWKLLAGAAGLVALPVVETQVFNSAGDIADDSAIWVNPADPTQSLVVADNKADSGGGLGVFDMTGKMVSYKADGKIGNVDLRGSYTLGGQTISIVGANNRSNDTLVFYKIDPATRSLVSINARTISTMSSNYGFCFYQSPTKLYANVLSQSGGFQQWELFESNGKVDAKLVRSFSVGSISEGCVADDNLARLYIGQEDVSLWRYGAEPTAGSTRTAIDTVGAGHLVADIEGMSLAYGANNTGYLIVSSQGNSTYAVYDRGTNAFVKSFTVGSNGTIDGASGTDGVDVTSANLGGAFTSGMLVVHDEANTGSGTSNLKYVPLGQIVTVTPPNGTPAVTPTVTTTPTTTTTPTATPSNGTISLNDSTTGTGMNEFNFSGSWITDTPAAAYMSDNHYTNATGASYQIQFSGTQAKIYAEKNNTLGIMAVSIDGGTETMVDAYASTRQDQQLLYTSPTLSSSNHTIKVRVTGTKNAAASATYVTADRVDIISGTPTTTTPIPTPTVTTTPGQKMGDVNGDGTVNVFDLSVLLSNWGKNTATCDLNHDGAVNVFDLSILLSKWES